MNVPCPKTWWVEEERFLAGCYPGDQKNAATQEKLQSLLDAGVRSFISLQEPDEKSRTGPFNPYIPLLRQLARGMNVEIECVNFPIRDRGVPTAGLMRDILDAIQEAIEGGRCVCLHCWGGHGRTGTVVGCWLREHGLSGGDALGRITKLRRHDHYLAGQISPQTDAQCSMVRDWMPK